jgi:hypothetical protein
MGDGRGAYRVELREIHLLEDLGIDGDNIKVDLQEE